jgi:hypothetical protein
MKLKFILYIFILAIFFNINCKLTNKQDAIKIIQKYYEALKNDDYESISFFFSNEFYNITPKEKLLSILKQLKEKLGNVENFELISSKINHLVGTGKSGTYFYFTYSTKYTKYSSTEIFKLYKPLNSENIKIDQYDVRSDGFLK